jgi:phospholipase/lecithinase/hemolysin
MFEFLRARRRALAVAAASAATVFLVSCSGSDGEVPPLFQTMVAFGASTTDNGNACDLQPTNCPPSPPYASGRASNGPLWVDAVAARYGASAVPSRKGGTNYAYGDARTGTVPGVTTPPSVPSMVAQVEQYLQRSAYQSSPQTLFVVDTITVGNNIVDALTLAQTNPNAPAAVITQAVTDIVGIMQRLYASGGRHILVSNSTNIGRTPRAQALGAAAVAATTQMSGLFNGALAQQITILKANSPGLNVYVVDIFTLSEQAATNPASFGLTNGTQACFNTVPAPSVCSNPTGYFYWDSFHPTQAVGAIVAQRAIAAMSR